MTIRALCLAAVLSLAVGSAGAAAQAPPAPAGTTALAGATLVLDGDVRGLARDGSRAYALGSFGQAGPYGGPLTVIDPVSGARDPRFPALDGQVSDAVADGAGGAYVGGDFTEADGARRAGLVHVLADGSIDPVFTADVDGLVYALALQDGHLYVGGAFVAVDGQPRASLAAVDPATGAVQAFTRPAPLPSQTSVTELVAAPGRVYAGAGTVLALDGESGAALPGFTGPDVFGVRALALGADALYAGGPGYLVALDPATGAPRPGFSATPTGGAEATRSTVHALLLTGGRLLAGGSFGALGGASGALVALDPATGAADPGFTGLRYLDSARSFGESGVFDLAQAGGRLWAGGSFSVAGSRRVTRLVALDPPSGAVQAVTPVRLDGEVDALVGLGGRLLTGGKSIFAGVRRQAGLTAFDSTTGRLSARFAPPGRLSYRSENVTAGAGSVVIGQLRFPTPLPLKAYGDDDRRTRYPGDARGRARTGSAPTILDGTTGRRIATLALHRLTGVAIHDGELVTAQRTNDVDRFQPIVLRRFSLRTGRLQGTTRLALPGYVRSLVDVDGSLYAAGSFKRRRPGGQAANIALVRFSARTGAVADDFDPHISGPVYDLTGDARTLFATGDFGRTQRQPRRGAVAVDAQSGAVLDFRAPPLSQGRVEGLRPLLTDAGVALVSLFGQTFPEATLLSPRTGRPLPASALPAEDLTALLPGSGAQPDLAARQAVLISRGTGVRGVSVVSLLP